VEAFVEDIPSQMEHLRGAWLARDSAQARAHAHTLKGGAATVAACALSAIAREMEEVAERGDLEAFAALLAQAEEAFESFVRRLRDSAWIVTKEKESYASADRGR
jgi:HPt (histidine-containing phosphotransfer) domain-containing protein